jgi:hypothetical protein
MLRLTGGQVESLFDQLLPVEVRELPADLAALDRLLADPRLLAPIVGKGLEARGSQVADPRKLKRRRQTLDWLKAAKSCSTGCWLSGEEPVYVCSGNGPKGPWLSSA